MCLRGSEVIFSAPDKAPLRIVIICFNSALIRSSMVTTYHAKFLPSEQKVCPLTIAESFWCASGTTTSSSKFSHTPVRSLVRSVPCLQYEICILQVTISRKLSNKAVGRPAFKHDTVFSTLRLASTKHGWSKIAQWFGNTWQITSHLGWALAWGLLNHSSTSSVSIIPRPLT